MYIPEQHIQEIKNISNTTPISYYDVRRIYEYCNREFTKVKQYIEYGLSHNEDPVMLAAIRKLG